MRFKTVLGVAAAGLLLAGAVVAQPAFWGMGPGMMGGFGPYGGGYGMGPAMMGGGFGPHAGAYGRGPGMMWGGPGRAGYESLKLSDEQRRKIADIQESTSKAMWSLMGTMREQGGPMRGMFGWAATDEAAARKAYDQMAETRKAMFEMQLEARRKIDAVLTQEQREQLRR